MKKDAESVFLRVVGGLGSEAVAEPWNLSETSRLERDDSRLGAGEEEESSNLHEKTLRGEPMLDSRQAVL